jgi:hypothetical protein
VNNLDKAQAGLKMIKDAILSELKHHPDGMTNAEITHNLGLESDSDGKQRNYLAWSILALLLSEGKIKSELEGRHRSYLLI